MIVNNNLFSRVALATSNYYYFFLQISEVVVQMYFEFYICTCFAVISGKSQEAVTRVTVDTILTRSTITACVINTIVDVWKRNKTDQKMI